MVILRSKGGQKPSSNIVLWSAVYDAVRKWTVIPTQETKKECMMIMQQKKVRLVNDVTSRSNPDLNSGIYLTATKLAQYILVADNKREKEEAKKETENKTATRKLHLQQK